MAQAHILISSTTVGTATSTVTLSSIPATYRDLILVVSGTFVSGTTYWNYQFNGDTTAANYPYVAMNGNSTTAGNNNFMTWSSTATATTIIQILDYVATDKHKTSLARNNAGQGNTGTEFGTFGTQRWTSTAAITSITCSSSVASFVSGTTFTLYGVSA